MINRAAAVFLCARCYVFYGVGLDIRTERRYVEVQKGSWRVPDWTLERREGMLKSKKEVDEWRVGC